MKDALTRLRAFQRELESIALSRHNLALHLNRESCARSAADLGALLDEREGEPSEEQVEQAAIGLWGAFEDLCWVSAEDCWKFGMGLGDDPEAERRDFRKYARAALKAARGER